MGNQTSEVMISAQDTELLSSRFYDIIESKSGEAVLVKTYYDYKDLSTEQIINCEYRFDYQQIDESRLDLYIYSEHIADQANYVAISFKNSIVRLPRELLTRLVHFVVEIEAEVIDDKLTYTTKLINPRYRENTTNILLQDCPIELIINDEQEQHILDIESHYLSTKKSKLKEKVITPEIIQEPKECLIRLTSFDHFGIIIEKDKKQSTQNRQNEYRIPQSHILKLTDRIKEVVRLDIPGHSLWRRCRIGLAIVSLFGLLVYFRKSK